MHRCRTKKNKKWVQLIPQRPGPTHNGTCNLWRFWTRSLTPGESVNTHSCCSVYNVACSISVVVVFVFVIVFFLYIYFISILLKLCFCFWRNGPNSEWGLNGKAYDIKLLSGNPCTVCPKSINLDRFYLASAAGCRSTSLPVRRERFFLKTKVYCIRIDCIATCIFQHWLFYLYFYNILNSINSNIFQMLLNMPPVIDVFLPSLGVIDKLWLMRQWSHVAQ